MQIVHKLKQNAVVFGLLFAGLLVLFYPAYSNLFNQMQAHRMITDYHKAVDGKSDDTKKQEIAKAFRQRYDGHSEYPVYRRRITDLSLYDK